MSGQWEVVGKTKKDKQTGKSKKLSKTEMQKFVDNAPKVEDLLPLAQVKTLYAALDNNKAPVKPVEKAVKTKENEAKKAQKKPKEKKETSVKEKNNPPKTIEAAVVLITASDVQTVLEVGQLKFGEAPLVWLKGLASWLNTKLPVDHSDNAFTAKSWEYPLNMLSADTRTVLKKALKDVPEQAVQMFYDYCLTSMANDMTKGGPVSGYKMLLQLVATQFPSVAVRDLAKSATMRHSYQNRPAIGCSVMWALGLAGFKDLAVGLRVWQEVMFPVYELRHYTQFVTDYLKQLLARHSTSKALSTQQYLEVLDSVFSSRHAPSNDMKTHVHTLQRIVCNIHTDNRLHTLFEPLLSRLSMNSSPALKDELVKFLVECLMNDAQSYNSWRQLYTKYLPHSAILLRHLNSNYNSLSDRLPTKVLRDTVKMFKVTNDDMTKNRQKTEGLQECSRLCTTLLDKMTHGRSVPWTRLSLLLVLLLSAGVAFDINAHGSFKASKTGVLLANVGALKYGEQAWTRIQESSKIAYRWGEENVPVYWAKAREVLGPYVAVALDAGTALALQVAAGFKLVVQYCADKKPALEQWFQSNAPGLLESVSVGASQALDGARWIGALVLKYLSVSAEWLQENIFVGKLSPENLQRVTLEALNSTQALAAQTLSWLHGTALPSTKQV